MSALGKCWAVAKKDIRIYYFKGPVLIFGLLFPTFLFLAFAMGRNLAPHTLVPGLIGMAVFFTASAVTPAVLPFETRTRTLERLVAAPVTLPMIIAGDVLAAFLFGISLSLVPILISVTIVGVSVYHPLLLAVALILSAFCFAVLGALFSTPPTDNPSSIMTISNLVRLPLIFFSGVFLPIDQMPQWGQWLAAISPLTYSTELFRCSFGQGTHFPTLLCICALAAFTLAFWLLSAHLHQRNLTRRLWL